MIPLDNAMRRFLSTLRSLPAGSLKSTLLLPKTTLLIRPSLDAKQRRALLLKCTEELYTRQSERTSETGTFVLHDGPPYANGDLHMGTGVSPALPRKERGALIRENRPCAQQNP